MRSSNRAGGAAGLLLTAAAALVFAPGIADASDRGAGPAPTTTSCLDAWNAAPPPVHIAPRRPAPVVIEAFNGGVSIAGPNSSSQSEVRGNACTIWIAGPPGHSTFVVGAWRSQGTVTWRAPLESAGVIRGALPNADLGRDEQLTARAPRPVTGAAPNPASGPRIAHIFGTTGWAGGVRLFDTMAQAVRHLGRPGVGPVPGVGCQASWPGLHLSATFPFGFVGRGSRQRVTPCGASARVTSFTGVSTWSTSSGLRVGAPESEIEQRYPGATSSTSISTGITTWYLAPRRGGEGAYGLTAETVLGQVTALTVAYRSITYGAVIVGP